MGASARMGRGVWRLGAAAWLVLCGCSGSAIDAGHARRGAAPAAAARAAVEARLSLERGRAYRVLNVEAGAGPVPASAGGSYHEAYRRWSAGEVRPLPKSSTTAQ